ncbi:MAG: tRNA (adenosine(37)-N6)-dimethylallyltransferase MiaA [Bacteroidales bacterium]|nr:tRNA (adenosine(37)-N6)-dimethylallyltransferase MiaA [Bacteroidales bacterium]
MKGNNKPLLCIVGPTASGKTRLAVYLAEIIDGEIISADSRQVYRMMDIGTGKDKNEYITPTKIIPYHLIDIVEPGYHFSVFEYQRDFYSVYKQILSRNKQPILCGGSGMYIEAVLKNYDLFFVPENVTLRNRLQKYSMEQLIEVLSSYTLLHNISDTTDRNRLIRAIEIQDFYKTSPIDKEKSSLASIIFYVHFERDILRQRITERLQNRLHNGMIDEVKFLLDSGIKPESLLYYGLEYKFITLYLTHMLSYETMVEKLRIAIQQFAKRQVTWFRRMQRNGFEFTYIDGSLSNDEQLALMVDKLQTKRLINK